MVEDAIKVAAVIAELAQQIGQWHALLAKANRGESFTPEEHAALDARIAERIQRTDALIAQLPEK